ncbi:MAG: hypothetical protein ASARMPRED_003668 [Alectoria sarmentosa]|nr:MAG: hypothetical protein ASARMPRED_003668 [Alectoria sarmentosa]
MSVLRTSIGARTLLRTTFPISSRSLPSLTQHCFASSTSDWSGRQPQEHVANRKDELDVQSGSSQSGKRERAAGNENASQGTSEKDSGNQNEQAKKDHPEAPGPVIGMNDERGGPYDAGQTSQKTPRFTLPDERDGFLKGTMPRDPLIGLVGKPSSGKSTTLNRKLSVRHLPSKEREHILIRPRFTTIDPQRAIGYLQISCACARYDLSDRCKPNYGACVKGKRSVPIELLDVAGLVPGAHEGKGLGNKFLDDLRHADALIHVVDVSGTTDAEGKATRGYDPSQDIVWLRSEIVRWIEGNLVEKWGSIKRRHVAIKANPIETLQNQFSGYGSTPQIIARTLDRLKLKEPLEHWSPETISSVVNSFTDEKFPTVFALNKIDHPDADKNISKIAKMQDPQSIVLCSAISEVFLRKLAKQGFVRYVEGSELVDTREDLVEMGEADGGGLKELDEKLKTRIENLKDMVLYRFGSTGVVQVLSRAAELLGLVPVFPVRNIHGFGAGAGSNAVFRDCVLVQKGTTVRDCARKIMGDAPLAYVEGAGAVRVSEDEVVEVGKNDVLSFKVGR